VTEGQDTTLTCKVKGKPQPTVEWFKDDKPVETDKRVKVDYDGEASTLTIKDTTVDDEGDYKCVVTNELGSTSTVAEVLVNEKAGEPTIKTKLENIETEVGKEVKFTVEVEGSPAPEVDWYKGDKAIEDKDRFMIVDDEAEKGVFSLLIDEVKPEDSGVYSVVAFNEAGEVKAEATLNVLDKEIEKEVEPEIIGETEVAPEVVEEVQGKNI
jgi:hypothetical protein